MDTSWNTVLWSQFGATIDMLDNALVACPESLWRERLWRDTPGDPPLPEFAEFWFVAYHALFWLDLYLSGSPEEDFTPPAPFAWVELDPDWVVPERPYTRAELRAYLASLRQKCQTTLVALTDEQARRPVAYPWAEELAFTYLELQLYNMRHVQEHAARLALALGQHGIHTEESWVARPRDNHDEYCGG